MKKLFPLMLAALLSAPVLQAESLMDAIKKATDTAAESSVCSVRNGKVQCNITHIDLLRSLYLPDAAFDGETYSADSGRIILLIRGTAENKHNEPAHFMIPDFVSQNGKTFECEDTIRYKSSKMDAFSLKLNPHEKHRFICFYILPIQEVLNGSLLFEKELISFSDNNSTALPLPINADAKLKDSLSLPGVTDM